MLLKPFSGKQASARQRWLSRNVCAPLSALSCGVQTCHELRWGTKAGETGLKITTFPQNAAFITKQNTSKGTSQRKKVF